jgi:hypothetical protein
LSRSGAIRPEGSAGSWPGMPWLGLGGLLLVLIGYAVLLHGAFWRGDDPSLLRHALDSPGLRAFHDAAHWQALSPSNLTPWAVQSLRLDALVAGLSPDFFYARQLAALAAVLIAGFVLLRPWLGRAPALAALAVFSVSASTASVIQQLMTRHYLEGLLFALLALLAHQRALRSPSARRSAAWALAAAAAYALACTAKEVYVPLVLVAAVWPGVGASDPRADDWRRRALALGPWLLVALMYVLWRRAMLPSMVGGYGALSALVTAEGLGTVVRSLAGLPALWLAPAAWGAAGRLLATGQVFLWLLCLLLALAWPPRRARRLVFAGVVAVAVLGPLLPLVSYPGLTAPDRYLFLPVFVACVAGAWALKVLGSPRGVSSGRWLPAGAALLTLVTAAAGLAQTADVQRHTLGAWLGSFDAQGRQLMAAPATDTLLPGRALLHTFWYVTDLCALRERQGQGACPQVLVPGWPAARPVERLWVFDDAAGAWREAGSDRAALLAGWMAGDERTPMRVEMTLEGGWIRWAFAAGQSGAEPGAWYVASPELGRFPVPASGALRMTRPSLTVQVQFEPAMAGPGPVRVVSPVLRVAPAAPVRWQRDAASP